MDKENNRSAAGLRRSAVAERIRLREEWSQLKGIDNNKPYNVLNKKTQNKQDAAKRNANVASKTKQQPRPITSDVLHGVVALVEVGAEIRALALRAALNALGATVVPAWSPLVTHLVWAQGGCRSTRAKARVLACRLVSPLWVEACAAALRRLPEQTFPAATRPSDLPSPRTLRRLLKQAERDNIPLVDLLSDSKESEGKEKPRLRMSSETDTSHDKSDTTNTSRDTSNDTIAEPSPDIRTHQRAFLSVILEETLVHSNEKQADDVESRVNTAPRRALPVSITPPSRKKSRRKLFTQKEAQHSQGETSEDDTTIKQTNTKTTQNDRKALARAERMAKKLVTTKPRTIVSPSTIKPKIVLTGMSRAERVEINKMVRDLNGRIQNHVNKKTTHVLLGSCREELINQSQMQNQANITGISSLKSVCNYQIPRLNVPNSLSCIKARTLNALLGAARGCRVLHAQWIFDSFEAKKWLHHNGYEVQHLKKISEKARVERKALSRMRSEYAYDVFYGMKIKLSPTAEQRDAAKQLLTLCGAILIEDNGNGVLTQNGETKQNGGLTQDGRRQNGGFTHERHRQNCGPNYDIVIGTKVGEICSKWVFDSVAASRMRTTRRYVNTENSDCDLIEQLLRSMSA